VRTRRLETALGAAALAGAGALLVTVAAHGHNLAVDQVPLELATRIHTPALTAFMRGASGLAEPLVVTTMVVAATMSGVGRQAPGDLSWLPAAAVGGGGTLIMLLKMLLRRVRPTTFRHLAPVRGYSLPSGHAFMAMCLYGMLAHHGLRWLRARRPNDRKAAVFLLISAAVAVLLVGISRVYLGVHYPTDVLAGYVLALLWLWLLAGLRQSRPLIALWEGSGRRMESST
jgi:undecaprenyl-diphosphatase